MNRVNSRNGFNSTINIILVIVIIIIIINSFFQMNRVGQFLGWFPSFTYFGREPSTDFLMCRMFFYYPTDSFKALKESDSSHLPPL